MSTLRPARAVLQCNFVYKKHRLRDEQSGDAGFLSSHRESTAMVLELVVSGVVGFVLLVGASYVGTTMALRGFFGRDRYSYKHKPPSESSEKRGPDER